MEKLQQLHQQTLAKRRTQSSSAELQPTGLRRVLKKDRYRIVVMGAAAVGKTCIVSRLLYEQFVNEYRATVEELHSGEYELNGMPVTLDILDTSGRL
jgi:GTPase SAR1 family protein